MEDGRWKMEKTHEMDVNKLQEQIKAKLEALAWYADAAKEWYAANNDNFETLAENNDIDAIILCIIETLDEIRYIKKAISIFSTYETP